LACNSCQSTLKIPTIRRCHIKGNQPNFGDQAAG
jgi:hypothetical protein